MEEYNNNSTAKYFIIFAILLFIIFQRVYFDQTVLTNVEMEPFSEPIQEIILNGKTFEHKTAEGVAEITPIANYKIYGRVMDKHFRPSKLQWAAIYPYDATIAFGKFKHKEVCDNVKFRMVSTVVYYNWSNSAWHKHLKKYFNNHSELMYNITNNHICPANKNITRGLKKLKKRDVVYIEGYLMKFKLKTKDGKIEKGVSSTSRNDSFGGDNGYGNCEQIYVTRVVSRHGDFK